jgi:hypothetical protein
MPGHAICSGASILDWLIVALVGLAKSAIEFPIFITAHIGAPLFAKRFRCITLWDYVTILVHFFTCRNTIIVIGHFLLISPQWATGQLTEQSSDRKKQKKKTEF